MPVRPIKPLRLNYSTFDVYCTVLKMISDNAWKMIVEWLEWSINSRSSFIHFACVGVPPPAAWTVEGKQRKCLQSGSNLIYINRLWTILLYVCVCICLYICSEYNMDVSVHGFGNRILTSGCDTKLVRRGYARGWFWLLIAKTNLWV